MTLQIGSNEKIEGLPVLEVRDLLRRFSQGFPIESLDRAGYSRCKARKLIRALTVMGYFETGLDANLKLTSACRVFTRGSAAQRIKRETAAAVLNEFMNRVEKANNSEDFLMKITAVTVFGSYLQDGVRLGNLELAIELESKNTPNDLTARHRMYANHFEKSGRVYRHVGYECKWAEQEAWRTEKWHTWFMVSRIVKLLQINCLHKDYR